MPLSLNILAQLSPQAMSFFKLAFLIALLMVCILIGAAIFKKMQKRWREEDLMGTGAGLFDMDDLRQLKEAGKLTEEEYQKAMRITADKKKAAMDMLLAEERQRRVKELEKQGFKPKEIETMLNITPDSPAPEVSDGNLINTAADTIANPSTSAPTLDATQLPEKPDQVAPEKSQPELLDDDELGEELIK